MRRVIRITMAALSIALVLCGHTTLAQNIHFGESFELNSTLISNLSHEYTASSSIELKKGFFSEPDSVNRTVLQLDSEGYKVFPPVEDLTDLHGCVVGSLGGSVNVGAMGGLVYSIPLELPTGINGMQPKLAITYNNQAGNGIMGWGWDLTGLSGITRTGKTLYHDGEMSAADLSWNDRLLLDGKRLITVVDYTDSVEYRLEQDEMSKIMAYMKYVPGGGLFNYETVKVLDHFVVWKADGLIMEYGATNNSWINSPNDPYQALSWQLDKVSDRYGNAMRYHYQESLEIGDFYIDTIEYTINNRQGVTAQFAISFEYEGGREDYESYYIGGNLIKMYKQLLKGIKVTSTTQNKPLLKYEFTYNNWNNNRLYNLLSKVTLIAYDEENQVETINSTSFEWDSSSYNQLIRYSISNPTIFGDYPFTGDFNGDGYTDVALVPYKENDVYSSPVNIRIYLNDRHCGFEHASSMDITVPATLDWIHVLDINGDGLDDLAPYFYDTVPSTSSESTTVKVYINNSATQTFSLIDLCSIPSKGDVIIGDFNGNGNTDIILLGKKYETISISKDSRWTEEMPFIENVYYLGYQSGHFQKSQLNTSTLEGLGPVYNAIAADYNGDGTTEVLLVSINESGTGFRSSKIGKFDFNNSSNCLKITQDLLSYEGLYNVISGGMNWCHVFPGDFNGDGKADIIYHGLNGGWQICLSEGNNLGVPRSIFNYGLPNLSRYINIYYPSLKIVQQAMSNQYMVAFAVNDFDGDGCSDVGCTPQSNINKFYFFSKITIDNHDYRFRKQFYSDDGIQFHSQRIHVGNFLGHDNVSFLCSLLPDKAGESGTATIHSLNSVGRYNSIKSVTDGLNNTTSFTYDYLTPKAANTSNPFYSYNYTAPDAYGVHPVALPVLALKTSSVTGVNGSKLITLYRYNNAMYHKYGHGFMGFSSTIAETYHNSTDSLWTTRKVCFNETSTMGQYAMMLPFKEFSYINSDGYSIATNKTQYGFTNVTLVSDLTNLVVCPAMTNKTERIFSLDEDDELIATVTTTYQYDYDCNQTYRNTYGCTTTTQTVTENGSGNSTIELLTVKHTTLQNNIPKWILNRPLIETITRTRNNESISSKTCYTYVSSNNYQLSSVTVIPNNGSQPQDPLTLTTSYNYDDFGNVIETVTQAPYGIHGEQPRIANYEYGGKYQHRLLTRESKGLNNDGYVTFYEYDFHDRLSSVTDCNQKATLYMNSIFGTCRTTFPIDGTEQKSLTLWADNSMYKPDNASYYTWSKATGGVTAMTFYHKSGAELRNVTFDFQGNPIYVDKRYNAKGLLESESEPYRRGEAPVNIHWTLYHYDYIDRLIRVDYPDGSAKTFVYDGLMTTTNMIPSQESPLATTQTTVKTTNVLGWLRESVDADGTSVFYEYYADGNLKWTRVGNNQSTLISMEYDHAGNRTRLHDPDYCTAQDDLVSVFNAFGEEMSRTTPKNALTRFTYDKFGRMTSRYEEYEIEPHVTDFNNTYWYYNETTPHKGLLSSVAQSDQIVSYAYDTCQRVVNETTQYTGGETYVTQYAYDKASRISSVTYPSGFIVNQQYNTTGYSSVQTDGRGNELYRSERTTPMGQMESFTLGGILKNSMEYDPEKHLLTRIKTRKNNTNIQVFTFTYDGFCNLASRKDNMKLLEETFQYDHQNRLTGIWLGNTQTSALAYDGYGRMTSKTADGQTVFSNAVYNATSKPHAMDAATTVAGAFPITAQSVTYTGFDKAGKIKQGSDSLCYTYGYDHQRVRMEEHVGNTVRIKRYVGNCEYVTETDGGSVSTYWLTYLSGPTGVYAVVKTEGGRDKLHFVLKDNLGSWTTITDEYGTVEQRLSYDAWGNLRNPNTWSGDFNDVPLFDRGFTGHEHLYDFGLINMNGRMYDPVVSSFLSVDQYVQSPENAQGFNRYAYCMNNPLKYVDPSGWRPIGGQTSYTPNSSANAFDPYMFYGGRIPLEPRDLGLRELSTADPIITWMEENSLHGGGSGGIDTKGGWYKSDNKILWSPSISSQNDLDKLGISGKYLGQSFFDDKEGIYYSLLGYKVDMKDCYGLAGEVFSLIELALCKYEQDKVTSKKDIFDVSLDEPSTTNFGVIKYVKNSKNDNLYSFTCNGFVIYLHIYDSSSGKEENSMNAAFCGLSSSKKYNSNNHFNLSKHTTLTPGYNMYFNNPKANSNCWRVLIVFPDTTLRNNFIYRYNNVFSHGNH